MALLKCGLEQVLHGLVLRAVGTQDEGRACDALTQHARRQSLGKDASIQSCQQPEVKSATCSWLSRWLRCSPACPGTSLLSGQSGKWAALWTHLVLFQTSLWHWWQRREEVHPPGQAGCSSAAGLGIQPPSAGAATLPQAPTATQKHPRTAFPDMKLQKHSF